MIASGVGYEYDSASMVALSEFITKAQQNFVANFVKPYYTRLADKKQVSLKINRIVLKNEEELPPPNIDTGLVIQLGGEFEKVGGEDEVVGERNQKVGSKD